MIEGVIDDEVLVVNAELGVVIVCDGISLHKRCGLIERGCAVEQGSPGGGRLSMFRGWCGRLSLSLRVLGGLCCGVRLLFEDGEVVYGEACKGIVSVKVLGHGRESHALNTQSYCWRAITAS